MTIVGLFFQIHWVGIFVLSISSILGSSCVLDHWLLGNCIILNYLNALARWSLAN